jgi:hypothetical protein
VGADWEQGNGHELKLPEVREQRRGIVGMNMRLAFRCYQRAGEQGGMEDFVDLHVELCNVVLVSGHYVTHTRIELTHKQVDCCASIDLRSRYNYLQEKDS